MSKSVQILGGPDDGAVYEVADDAIDIVIALPLEIRFDLRAPATAEPLTAPEVKYLTLPLEPRPLSEQARYIARWPRS